MSIRRKSEYIGVLGALLVYVTIIVLSILVSFAVPRPDEEAGGVPMMMGDADAAYGSYDPSAMVDVEVMPEEVPAPQPVPEVEAEREMITQTEEEAVVIKPKAEPKKEKPRVERKPERTAEKKAAEAKRLAEERAEHERRAAAGTAGKRVTGAFGKGSQMGRDKGGATSDEGIEGSRDSNLSTGAESGVGGYGTFNPGGRSMGKGGLPRPVYNVQEEGRVVVFITVNPAGYVVATSISRLTSAVNSTLRKATENAAKKARFNAVNGVSNRIGTITYYSNLK